MVVVQICGKMCILCSYEPRLANKSISPIFDIDFCVDVSPVSHLDGATTTTFPTMLCGKPPENINYVKPTIIQGKIQAQVPFSSEM